MLCCSQPSIFAKKLLSPSYHLLVSEHAEVFVADSGHQQLLRQTQALAAGGVGCLASRSNRHDVLNLLDLHTHTRQKARGLVRIDTHLCTTLQVVSMGSYYIPHTSHIWNYATLAQSLLLGAFAIQAETYWIRHKSTNGGVINTGPQMWLKQWISYVRSAKS